jgi:glycosyltransferase involved in cell wall biosynthesis
MGRFVHDRPNPNVANPQGGAVMAVDPVEVTSATKKLLILDGRQKDDGSWPLPPLLDRLERHGFEIQVLCISKKGDLAGDPRALEIPYFWRGLLRAFAARRIWAESRLERPDVLHVLHDELADVALGLSDLGQVPYVQTVADFATIERGLRLSRQWCRRVIATSTDLAAELAQELGIPPQVIALIPHGIPAQPEPTPKPAAWTIPVIGAAGPRDEISGLLLFTEAARLVVDAGFDVEFVIACHADLQNVLRNRTKQLGIAERVTLTDYPIAGPDFWSVLDIYCQPAVSASTGGMLMLALGRALPCIATNVKGLRNLIESGRDGVLVSPEDPIAVQKAIKELLDNADLARRLGQNACEQARDRFSLDVEADRLAELYREVSPSLNQSEASR